MLTSNMQKKSIQIPKEFHGKIIGKQAATKKDIESDYGVTLTFPDRNDPTAENILIEGPTNDSIRFAENRIRDICGLQSTGDPVSNIRAKVNALYEKKDDLFKQAYATPKGSPQRDALFAQANALKDECERASKQAAKEIFALKNQGYGDDQMDLHGLNVDEAEDLVNQRLTKVQSRLVDINSGFILSIITGAGHHSENHKAKIKPAIIEILTQRGFAFKEDETGGIILVGIATGATALPATRPPTTRPPQQAQPEEDIFTTIFNFIFHLFSSCTTGK